MTAYDDCMSRSATVMVLPHRPNEEEVDEYVYDHLETLDDDEVRATADIQYCAPDWMSISEQDQINAYLRDGGVCVLVIYVVSGEDIEE